MKIDVRRNILEGNQRLALANQGFFRAHRVLAVNIMASPGAGKTSTILATMERLRSRAAFKVIEGDIASRIDTDTIGARGIPVQQINTGNMCHLDANMIGKVLDGFDYPEPSIIFVENVGNLVCPAEFSMGEDLNVVIASVPEGHDKPFKYPAIFMKADAVLLNKTDTVAAFDFDRSLFYEGVRGVNRSAPCFEISCRSGEGLAPWCEWLIGRFQEKIATKAPEVSETPELSTTLYGNAAGVAA